MSTLAIILNSSPARWSVPPLVEYAMLILPGFAFAYAMNSGTDLAGTDGCTTMIFGRRTTAVTGSMSRMKLKLKRITIGGRTHDRLGRNIGARAWSIFDDELL